MTDVNGYRAKFGNIIPSTNTTVEHDFAELRIPGVTFHSGRILVQQTEVADEASVRAQIDSLGDYVEQAFASVLTCKPDYWVMGMSGPTFWGGKRGAEAYLEKVSQYGGGLGITTGAIACLAALRAIDARSIAVLSPYQPVAEENVRMYFTDYGFDVKRMTGLKCGTMTSIAEVTTAQLVDELLRIDGPDVDAIVQVGTDLSMVRLADEAERWLKKPVIAINAATAWHALRAMGIDDRIEGFGFLLREH